MTAERPFEVHETERFTAEIEMAIGAERWGELKPVLIQQLSRNPHRFPQIGSSAFYSIPLITGHAIYFTIDFAHGRVTLWRVI